MTVFGISNNSVGEFEEAADDIALALSCNAKLQKLHFGSNNFKTMGMIKIAKALHKVKSLAELNISNNNVGEEAADRITTVL